MAVLNLEKHAQKKKKKSNFPFSGCLNKTLTRARKWQRTAGGYKLSILAGSVERQPVQSGQNRMVKEVFLNNKTARLTFGHRSELKCSE